MAIVRDGDAAALPAPGVDGEGSLADLVHQTAMYYEDRLSGQGLSRVVVAARDVGARRHRRSADARPRARAALGQADRRDRPARPVRDRRRECHRRRAAPPSPRRSACCCANGWRDDAADQPRHPAVLQRAPRPLAARPAPLSLVVAFTAFNVSAYLRLSGRQAASAADAARDEAMARTLTARAATARRAHRRQEPRAHHRRRRPRPTASSTRARSRGRRCSTTSRRRCRRRDARRDHADASVPTARRCGSPSLGRTVEASTPSSSSSKRPTASTNVQPSSENVTEDGLFETQVDWPLPGDGAAAAPDRPPTPPGRRRRRRRPGRQGAR